MSRAKKEIMRLRQAEISAENANLVSKAQNAIEKRVARDAMDQENPKGYLEDVRQAGCQSGSATGMTYYWETNAFYEEYNEEIWNQLNEESENMASGNIMAHIGAFRGAENVGSDEQFRNLLAWWAYENAVTAILDRLENPPEPE